MPDTVFLKNTNVQVLTVLSAQQTAIPNRTLLPCNLYAYVHSRLHLALKTQKHKQFCAVTVTSVI